MIDYPGKISCVLFTSGCNFICPYCHNPELAQNRTERLASIEEEEVLAFLDSRRKLLDGVVVTGGEPTLHGDLESFCEKVKAMGYPIKLDTNGSRPKPLGRLLEKGLIDYVAMDMKTDPRRYAPVFHAKDLSQELDMSIRTILSAGIAHEFRTTCLAPFVDREIVSLMAKSIEGADLYALQQCNSKHVLDPEYIREKTTRLSDETLLEFQALAAPMVKKCVVR